ncbi:helix-turn-helix domain-containing protein [Paraburkholderia terrae]|uniref:helix-turn-helix domain-containing protein n=1 Tax=Paraburkholderia terrae TaxID=311230 RepID=UPI00296B348D|nr:LysR family transcriptional regulator [Paraburkholderia terrae]
MGLDLFRLFVEIADSRSMSAAALNLGNMPTGFGRMFVAPTLHTWTAMKFTINPPDAGYTYG